MHFSRLWNGVDGYSNALPKGRDVACHSFPQSRSGDLYSLEKMRIHIDFLRVRMDIPCIACELGFLNGIDENPLNLSEQECESQCTPQGCGGCDVVVATPILSFAEECGWACIA